MYVPVADRFRLTGDMDVNYMMTAEAGSHRLVVSNTRCVSSPLPALCGKRSDRVAIRVRGLALRFSNDSLTGRAFRVDDFPTG